MRPDGYYWVRFECCADIWAVGKWRNYDGRGDWQLASPAGVWRFVSDEAADFAEIGEELTR